MKLSSQALRCLWSSPSFLLGSVPASHLVAQTDMRSGSLSLGMGIAATIPNWNKGWPHWYWLSWLLSWPISCLIGLLLSGRRTGQSAQTAA